MSNPRFSLHLPVVERKALRLAAAEADQSMTDFIRAAISEQIARQSKPPRNENAASAAHPAATPPTLPNEGLAQANAEKAA